MASKYGYGIDADKALKDTVICKRSFNRAKPTNSPHRTPPKFVRGAM